MYKCVDIHVACASGYVCIDIEVTVRMRIWACCTCMPVNVFWKTALIKYSLDFNLPSPPFLPHVDSRGSLTLEYAVNVKEDLPIRDTCGSMRVHAFVCGNVRACAWFLCFLCEWCANFLRKDDFARACAHLRGYVCMYVSIYVYTCIYVYIYIYICMYMRIYIYIHMNMCICKYMHIHMCICIYIHIHI